MFFASILAKQLGTFPDVQRSLQRLTLNKGTPADICCISRGIESAQEIEKIMMADNSNVWHI